MNDVVAGVLLGAEVDAPVKRTVPTSAVAFVVVLVGVLRWAVVSNPLDHLWLEDAAVWLRDGNRGFTLDPYMGYLHLVPRVAGWLVALLPAGWAPGGFLAATCAVVGFSAVVVWHGTAAVIDSTAWRVLVTVSLSALPMAGWDAMMTVTHAQWWLIPAACWGLFLPPSKRWLAIAVGLAAALSSALLPFALAPVVFAGRKWRHPAFLASLVWVVQVPFLLSADRDQYLGGGDVRVFTFERFGGALIDREQVPAVVGAAILAGVVWVVRGRELATGFVVSGGLLYAVATFLNGSPAGRYSITAWQLIVAGLALCADRLPRRLPVALATVWVLSFPATFYERTPLVTWRDAVATVPCIDGVQVIDIGPSGFVAERDC